ncbi:F-box protein At3g44326-like [Daucus carota subsp. sativus]
MALTSHHFHAVCSDDKFWTQICNSTWASTNHPLVRNALAAFPAGHASFFSDSFRTLHFEKGDSHCRDTTPLQRPNEFISAVDLRYRNQILCSEVNVTDTSTQNFMDSCFEVEAFADKKQLLSNITESCEDDEATFMQDLRENITLSWIIIDPTQKRAANISSRRPVSVRSHWIDGDVEIKFAVIMPEFVETRLTAMLKWSDCGKLVVLSGVRLQLHDMDGLCLSGKTSLRILQEAIRSGGRKKAREGEETRIHGNYVEMKRERRQVKDKTRRTTTLLIAAISLAFVVLPVNMRFSVSEQGKPL